MTSLEWISPALVAAGVITNIALSMRREAKESGVRQAIQEAHERRLNTHRQRLDGFDERLGVHGERLASLESWRKAGGD